MGEERWRESDVGGGEGEGKLGESIPLREAPIKLWKL